MHFSTIVADGQGGVISRLLNIYDRRQVEMSENTIRVVAAGNRERRQVPDNSASTRGNFAVVVGVSEWKGGRGRV